MTDLYARRRLRRICLPGRHHFRVTHFTNHYEFEVWFFAMRLHFKATWSGQKTTHWWRIRQWGFREWVGACVYHHAVTKPSWENPGAAPFESFVARAALVFGRRGE